MNPPPIVVMVSIKAESDRRGRYRTAIDATALNPDYDVTVTSQQAVRAGHSVAADVSIKVAPKKRPSRS